MAYTQAEIDAMNLENYLKAYRRFMETTPAPYNTSENWAYYDHMSRIRRQLVDSGDTETLKALDSRALNFAEKDRWNWNGNQWVDMDEIRAIQAREAAKANQQMANQVRANQATTQSPSGLAAQESGAIGASSIASQQKAAQQRANQQKKQSTFVRAARPSYRVKSGDTLSSIARQNNMSLAKLLKFNPALRNNPKYQGGNRIFSNTKINLGPKPQRQLKTRRLVGQGSVAQWRQGEQNSMQMPTNTPPLPQPNQLGFR